MKGFDFGQIGDVVSKIMDSDYIDIKRNIDGSLVEVYSNISCHIAYVSIDNPDPQSIDIKPIIQAMRIHLPLWVDVRNDDYIVAKKVTSDGEIGAVYSGRCGNPVVSQGRKKVLVTMDATEPEVPTPIPSEYDYSIVVKYLYNNIEIRPQDTIYVKAGYDQTFNAPFIEGYNASSIVLDGEAIASTSITLREVDDNHSLSFVYAISSTNDEFRFLVNGLFTKNDGTLSNGWHTYKGVPIDSITDNEGVYTITSDNISFEHRDNGKILKIEPGAILVLFPNELFVKIKEILNTSNGKVTFTCNTIVPTQAQEDFYKTGWYD